MHPLSSLSRKADQQFITGSVRQFTPVLPKTVLPLIVESYHLFPCTLISAGGLPAALTASRLYWGSSVKQKLVWGHVRPLPRNLTRSVSPRPDGQARRGVRACYGMCFTCHSNHASCTALRVSRLSGAPAGAPPLPLLQARPQSTARSPCSVHSLPGQVWEWAAECCAVAGACDVSPSLQLAVTSARRGLHPDRNGV